MLEWRLCQIMQRSGIILSLSRHNADAGILVTGSYIDIESNIITGSSGDSVSYCGSVIYGAVGFCNIIMLGGNSIYLQISTQIEIAQKFLYFDQFGFGTDH